MAFGPAIAHIPSCIGTSSISPTPTPTNINLGTAAGFVIFTSSGAVSNTGSTILTGNIGSDLGAISGFGTASVTGSFYNADTVTAKAKTDLLNAYNQLSAIPATVTSHAPAFGGGEILSPGVYSIGGAGSVVGNLILDAQGDSNSVFIFKIGGAFTTAASSKVCLINRALPSKIFWVVEGAIAIAASTTIKGTLIANNAAVSMAAGGDLQGRMLSTAGAISFGPGSAYITNQRFYTWASTGSNLFSVPANWSPIGNPGCSCMDNVTYNGLSTVNCNFDEAVSVNNFSILTGYSGTVNAQTNKTIINADYGQAAGVFSGSTNSIYIYGNYTLNGGAFNSTSGVLTSEGAVFSNGGGTFNHNNGTVVNNRPSAILAGAISGAFIFNQLEFTSSGNTTERLINFNSSASAITLNLNGGGAAFGYSGNINITSSLIINGSNTSVPSINTAIFNIAGVGAKTISGTGANLRNPLGNIVINTTGTLAMFNNINISNNWTNTNTGLFTIGTSTVNIIGIGAITSGTSTATRANFDNLAISTASTLNLNNNSQINIGVNLTDNGVLNTNTGLIRLNGTSAQCINGSSILTTISALEITSAGVKNLLHSINILDSVKIDSGILASSTGNLILKSTTSLKARIAEITGGGSISGTIGVETFALGGTTDWAQLGASGVSGLTIANWEGQIPMCCSLCPYNQWSTGSYFVSVQGWDETAAAGSSQAYVELNYNTPLNVGQGYWIFLGTGLHSTANIIYSVTGAAVTGNQSISVTNSGTVNGDGYNLISNPYASPISWAKLRNGNTSVANAIYIYNADLGLTTSYVNGVSSPASASANDVIPMGQGFFVQALANTTLVAKESNKISNNTSSNQLLKTANASQVFRLRVDGFDGSYDETVLRFEQSASNYFDSEWDAYKVYASPAYNGAAGAWDGSTAIATQYYNVDYSINSLPDPINQDIVMPVIVRVHQTGQYIISPIDIQNLPSNFCANLFDNATNVTHDLKTGSYSCLINDTTVSARFILTICEADTLTLSIAENKYVNSVMINTDATGVMVNLDFSQATQATISVTNILGQNIIKDITVYTSKDLVHIDLNTTNEILFVSVTTSKKRFTKKIIR